MSSAILIHVDGGFSRLLRGVLFCCSSMAAKVNALVLGVQSMRYKGGDLTPEPFVSALFSYSM